MSTPTSTAAGCNSKCFRKSDPLEDNYRIVTTSKILVVDDSREICRFLKHTLLEPAGYQVLIANNGTRAIHIARQHQPHLILLDINLPDISGIEVLQRLKSNGHTAPVIMITSHTDPATILQAFRLGAKDYLSKPFAPDDALAAIDKALSAARWQREREQMTIALARANHKLKEQIKVWEALDKIGRAITATLNEKDAQRRLMQGINQIMRVEAGSLFLVDARTGDLVLKVSLRGKLENNKEIRLSPGQGVAGWVLQHKQPVLISDAYKDKRFFPGVDQRHTGFLTRSILAVPLIVHNKAVGVIQVLNPIGGKRHFDASDLHILETLASSVAVAVENARLYERMRTAITIDTLRKTVTTLSHHINNSLTVIIMLSKFLQDKAESLPDSTEARWLTKSTDVLQQETSRIVEVLNVLNQVTNIRETNYLGDEKMIDIDAELAKGLSHRLLHQTDG